MWTRIGSALALLIGLAFALPARAEDEIEFYDTLNTTEVTLGDTVSLSIQLSGGNTATADIRLPPLPEFEVITQHRSTSVRMSLGSGAAQVVRTTVLTVVLQPKRSGSLRIPPVTAVAGGRAYKTGELTLRVLPADPNRPRHQAQAQNDDQDDDSDPNKLMQQFFGGNPFRGMPGMDPDRDPFDQMLGEGGPPRSGDIFLRTAVDKKQAYLGEQVTLSIYLFSRLDVARVDNPKLPKLDAFWAEDIDSPTNITGEPRTVNGVPYRVYLLKRRALFPLKAGKQVIDPVEVDVVTGLSLFGNGHTTHLTSQALEVAVQPLPAGAPAGFATTNVGQWRMNLAPNPASSGPVQAAVGQPVTLDLTIEGFGNLRNLTLPKLPAVRGFRSYDPTTTDKVQIAHGRFGGKRTVEFVLIPEQTGSFELPAMSLPFFNPQTQAYETATTQPIKFEVSAGAGGAVASATPGAVGPNANAGQNVLGANLSRPIHTKGELGTPAPLYGRSAFLPLLLLPFGVLLAQGVASGVKARAGKDDPAKRIRTAQSRARRRFKGAEALLDSGDSAAYYGTVAKTLNDYLTDKLGLAAAGLTREELARRLAVAGARPESVSAVNAVLEACDLGRFAPGSGQARRDVLDQAAEAVEGLEAQRLKRTDAEARA